MVYPAAGAIPGYPTHSLVSRFMACSMLCLASVACGESTTAVDDQEQEQTPPNPCTSAVAISVGQSSGGQLSATDCRQPDGAYGDRWSLSLLTATDVRIDLTSNAFDAFLELRDNAGNLIAANDDAGGSLDSRLIQQLQAGSYIIVARSLGTGQTGNYQLSVREGPDCSPVGDLTLGVTATGTLAADDCLFEFGGVMDNWSLSLTCSAPDRIRRLGRLCPGVRAEAGVSELLGFAGPERDETGASAEHVVVVRPVGAEAPKASYAKGINRRDGVRWPSGSWWSAASLVW